MESQLDIIHILMHIHILKKGCGDKSRVTGTHIQCCTVTPMFACNYAKGSRHGKSGRHVYMY